MRVLLRDKRDDALAVVEAIEMNYDPSDKELCICLHGGDSYTIENLTFEESRTLITKLYQDGMVSTTGWVARYDPADEYIGCEGDDGDAAIE